MGLKTISEQFREDLLKVNLRTPPDIIIGISDFGGSVGYSAYRDELGRDGVIHSTNVLDPGNIVDISHDFREYLMKRNLQTPSDIEEAIIDLSANQSETLRNMGAIGTDATINWRSVVVDVGTIDNAAMVTRMDNLSRNKPRDVTDPSESNSEVVADSYNYTSLLQGIGEVGMVNDFAVPNLQSVSSKSNPVNEEAIKLDLQTNRYSPDEYTQAVLRDAILNKAYERTTYVTDYTNSLKQFTPEEYFYRNFYNVNMQASLPEIMRGETTLIQSDTMLMNIGAYMLNFNLQKRFEQNLYNATYGAITLNEQNYESTLPPTMDPLDMIRVAKDPLDNLVEKNFTITVPRNFVSKAAQFLLGLEGVASPFTLWESVDMSNDDLTPQCFLTNEGIDAMKALDPTYEDAANQGLTDNATNQKGKKNDDELIRKTGGGQRWALYENMAMNKYSPRFDTRAELLNFSVKKPEGNYYLGSPDNPPTELLQTREGFSVINNNVLSATFRRYGSTDYVEPSGDIVWESENNEWVLEFPGTEATTDDHLALSWDKISANSPDAEAMNYGSSRPLTYSTSNDFRPCSLLDVTQRLLWAGKMDSPISNIKTRFRDGDYVYSKGNATTKVEVAVKNNRNVYTVPLTKQEIYDQGFCRTWTKVKPFRKVAHLVRYGELIRRERNSVIDRNANYNIFPSALNVGTIYDQNLLLQDGIRDRFADKNFNQVRARKYMFSIENLAWRESEQFESLPTYQQGPSGGRIMWFPPYGLTFNETSSANWTKHDFLGRPEPIYTYNNTERTGTLSWMVIVDHPTILNLLVQKELASLSEAEVDAILAAFWAGCMDYDIFELARIWGVFSNDDIRYLKSVIDGEFATPATMTVKKQDQVNYAAQVSAQQPAPADTTQQRELLSNLNQVKFFFPNDIPTEDDATYFDIENDYYSYLTTGSTAVDPPKNALCPPYQYRYYVGEGAPYPYFFSTDYPKMNWMVMKNLRSATSGLLKDYCDNSATKSSEKLVISLNAYASSVSPDNDPQSPYNHKLARRRAKSVVNWFATPFTETGEGYELKEIENTETGFTYQIVKGGRIYVEFVSDPKYFMGLKPATMLNDLGLQYDTYAVTWTEPGPPVEQGEDIATNVNDYASKNCDKTQFSVLSYPACYSRRVDLKAKVEQNNTPQEDPDIYTSVKIGGTKNERYNLVNKRDIATRILSKLIGENEYFAYLNENSPVVFNSLKEKLKYFSPAFHSMTPEGLNARLTFLQQCVRPGNTIKSNPDTSVRYDVVNTAFGKPPVCVIRIGDFFNTKMIIDTLNIEYNVVGSSITYDLNPEGIGVQPMLAKVTMTVKYIGGAGLREPVAQLQNALSFNYYANADIYESMSYGQTNMDERILENLELGYESDVLDIDLLKLNEYQDITYDPQTNFDYIGKIVKTYEPISSYTVNPEVPFNPDHKIKNELDIVKYLDLDYYDAFKKMYDDYSAYIEKAGISWAYPISSSFTSSGDMKLKYDFFLLLYAGIFNMPDFGKNKKIDKSLYPHLETTGGTISDYTIPNYFSIGYDAFKKSNNFVLPILHLYPQKRSRIVSPAQFELGTFAGVVFPRYVDPTYVNRQIDVYAEMFKGYLRCEQWFAFTGHDDLRDRLFALPIQSRQVFRNAAIDELTTYVSGLKTNWGIWMNESVTTFKDAYDSAAKLVPVIAGVDGGASPIGINYLEVAPMLSGSTIDLTHYFNFDCSGASCDPLNFYPYNLTDEVFTAFAGVNSIVDDPTLGGINCGNFKYLKNQLTGSTFQSEGYLYYDFTTSEWKTGSTVVTDITISSAFEKMNYEFLYFSNLTLDILKNDMISGVAREFTFSPASVDLSTSFNNMNVVRRAAAVRDIQNALGLGNATNYDYNYIKYISNSATPNTAFEKTPTVSNLYSAEDVMFFGFAKEIMGSASYADALYQKMINSGDFKQSEKKAIEDFVNNFKSVLQQEIAKMDGKLKPFWTEFSALEAVTKSNWESALQHIAKGANDKTGYQLKMFEVDFTKANVGGKSLLNSYYKFKKENS